MGATLALSVVDAAPGNTIQLSGSGLTGGGPAGVTLSNQGVTAQPGLSPRTITLPATFDPSGTFVSITMPDGIMDGVLTVTASDSSTATCALRARSQYVQASEYLASGEGTDTSSLAPGQLDAILRRASGWADTFMLASIRQLQVLERHKYRENRESPPRIYPFRTSGRECPIISIDQLTFVSAQDLVTVFENTDTYVNDSSNYIEILAYAVGNYALLGALEVIGYSANVYELSYTSGYPMASYPQAVCDATIMIASEILANRLAQQAATDAFESVDKGTLQRRKTPFSIPLPARTLLAPYCARTMR